jgi:hypothetical protein
VNEIVKVNEAIDCNMTHKVPTSPDPFQDQFRL